MKGVLEAATKSIWTEIRDLALKKGTETLVAEGIKSVIEVVKRRHIRRDEYDFAEWKKAQSKQDKATPDEKAADEEATPDKAESDEPGNGPVIAEYAEAIRAAGGEAELFEYPGSVHAFYNDARPEVFQPDHAALAWDRTLAFLRARLG